MVFYTLFGVCLITLFLYFHHILC